MEHDDENKMTDDAVFDDLAKEQVHICARIYEVALAEAVTLVKDRDAASVIAQMAVRRMDLLTTTNFPLDDIREMLEGICAKHGVAIPGQTPETKQ